MESSLELLERAQHLRETGGSPSTASPRPSSSVRRHRGGSPSTKGLSDSPGSAAGATSNAPGDGRGGEEKEEGQDRAKKKRKVELSRTTGGGGGGGGDGGLEDEDEDDDDVFRWQVPYVMGTLCAQLGKEPRVVLENFAQALRLAKVKHYTPRVDHDLQ